MKLKNVNQEPIKEDKSESEMKPGVWYTDPECCMEGKCDEETFCDPIEVDMDTMFEQR
jgi:hypothetical protein